MKQATRGRPVDRAKQTEQKANLLKAGLKLLSEKTYRAITIRELADSASVNSAMIRYYFDNKEGLFIALFDQLATQHFSQLTKVIDARQPIKSFITQILKMMSENQGLARFVHDEVLQNDSTLRDAFIERFPKRMAQLLPKMVQQEFPNIDSQQAKLLAFNLMSLIITPFVGEPVRKIAWQIEDKLIFSEAWVDHLYQLFIYGGKSFSASNNQLNTDSLQQSEIEK